MLCGMNVRRKVCAALAMAWVALTATAQADVISPLNGSFEADNGNAGWSAGLLTGVTPASWQASAETFGGSVAIIKPASQSIPNYAAPVDGTAVLELQSNGTAFGLFVTGVQQDLGAMVSGHKYTFAATLYSNVNLGTWMPQWSWASKYRISFYDATESRELAAITQADCDPSALGPLQSLPTSFSYTATSAVGGHTLRLIMNSESAGDGWVAYRTGVDGVSVTTTVPEPSTCGLLGTALIGLLAYAWRKQK